MGGFIIKKYIDCDGVILDTEKDLFKKYDKLKLNNQLLTKRQYLEEIDWNLWIYQAEVINDAINLLKNFDYKDTSILTKVHTVREAIAKIKYFRELKLKNEIIIVPFDLKKSEVVTAKGNILVDDFKGNLDAWQLDGGISIYFGDKESLYPSISSLEEVLSGEILKRIREK